jgi:hypothetical protein
VISFLKRALIKDTFLEGEAALRTNVGFETEDAVDVGSIVSLTDGWMDSMKSDNVKKREKT